MHDQIKNTTTSDGKCEHITPRRRVPARRATRGLKIGPVPVGGGAPVSVQSMTNTDPGDPVATLAQIQELAGAGCDIVRVAIPTSEAVRALLKILKTSPVPIVADIHFDPRLAVRAIEAGAHGIRINPGNIGGPDAVRAVAEAAVKRHTPIRVGVNGGSLEKDILARFGGPTPAALAESALRHCKALESVGCRDIKVSLKSSDAWTTVAANRIFAARTDYPLHLGVTEAGTERAGVVKSAVGIGALLLDGIGDTIRVSLTAPPVHEVDAALRILEACGLREAAPEIVACPTCGRTQIDLIALTTAVEREISRIKAAGFRVGLRKIAIMGCAVNGPGEARDADIGIAGGNGRGVLFRNGEVVRSFPEHRLFEELMVEIRARTRPAVPPPVDGLPKIN